MSCPVLTFRSLSRHLGRGGSPSWQCMEIICEVPYSTLKGPHSLEDVMKVIGGLRHVERVSDGASDRLLIYVKGHQPSARAWVQQRAYALLRAGIGQDFKADTRFMPHAGLWQHKRNWSSWATRRLQRVPTAV